MKNRSVIEIMVLTFTFVVAFGILATGALVVIIEIRDPSADTRALVQSLVSITSGILGALLGLIAGKNETTTTQLSSRPDESTQSTEDPLHRRVNPDPYPPPNPDERLDPPEQSEP
jgi:hypothetical protein